MRLPRREELAAVSRRAR